MPAGTCLQVDPKRIRIQLPNMESIAALKIPLVSGEHPKCIWGIRDASVYTIYTIHVSRWIQWYNGSWSALSRRWQGSCVSGTYRELSLFQTFEYEALPRQSLRTSSTPLKVARFYFFHVWTLSMNSPLLETLFNFFALHRGMTFFEIFLYVVNLRSLECFESSLIQDFLSFYCFVLLLLPENDFDQLGSCWVALKAAHDAFQVGMPIDDRHRMYGADFIYIFIWFHMISYQDSTSFEKIFKSLSILDININSPARLAQGIGQILYQKAWSPSGLAVGWRSFPSFMPSSRYWAEFSWNLSCQLIFMDEILTPDYS